MSKGVFFVLPILAAAIFFGHALTGLSSVNAQNMTVENNMTTSTNMTNATKGGNMTGANMTTSEGSGSSAKMHLEEGINWLKIGDTQVAMTHLSAAHGAMSNAPPGAIKHFDEGMKALESGENNQAIMHFSAADKALS